MDSGQSDSALSLLAQVKLKRKVNVKLLEFQLGIGENNTAQLGFPSC
jgi:hypothetical protein